MRFQSAIPLLRPCRPGLAEAGGALNAVYPGIGGVLVRGEKGTAKSTAARAWRRCVRPCLDGRRLPLPLRSRRPVAQVPALHRSDGEHAGPACGCACRIPRSLKLLQKSHPPSSISPSATEDRVLGTLDLERALREGRRAFQPGLLAAAHRGVLYIDEVNLLPDHLVDILLDAAALGINTVQREGVAFVHPARFLLVGTMNPEEGDLRPQFLDRFGLMVTVAGPREVQLGRGGAPTHGVRNGPCRLRR